MSGIERIAAERRRQIEQEGWSAEHDDTHEFGDLAVTAAVLAVHHTDARVDDPMDRHDDPWGLILKHGHDDLRCLEIAGALIAAEIDRLERAKAAQTVNRRWVCAKCKKPMQFSDGMCWKCFGGDPGR